MRQRSSTLTRRNDLELPYIYYGNPLATLSFALDHITEDLMLHCLENFLTQVSQSLNQSLDVAQTTHFTPVPLVRINDFVEPHRIPEVAGPVFEFLVHCNSNLVIEDEDDEEEVNNNEALMSDLSIS